MDQVNAMLAHWRQEPPVDVLFASFVGYKPPPSAARDMLSAEEDAAKAKALLATAYAIYDNRKPVISTTEI